MKKRKIGGMKYVLVEDVLEFINDLRKSNQMWAKEADELFSMLEDKLENE